MKNEGLVKTVKFNNPRYVGDPRNAVKIFNEKEVDEIIILDINTDINMGPNFELIGELASECFMPLCYGGGISNLEQIKKLFSIGVEKIALNSILHTNREVLKAASDLFGSQSIVASIDVKANFFGTSEVYTRNGTLNTKLNPLKFAQEMRNHGAGEILLNSIERDGTMKGYDLKLINDIASAIDIPLVACGGAGTLKDMKTAINFNASAAAAGSIFIYHGKHNAVLINYPKAEELIDFPK